MIKDVSVFPLLFCFVFVLFCFSHFNSFNIFFLVSASRALHVGNPQLVGLEGVAMAEGIHQEARGGDTLTT